MSDIFISYAKEDRDQAGTLAAALEEQGWSVWWDPKIPTGRVFDEVIETELKSAKCVVVLWSASSAKNRWVRREAAFAEEEQKLFPVLIERGEIPLAFRDLQAVDLVDWSGESTGVGVRQLIEDMEPFVSSASETGAAAAREPMGIKVHSSRKEYVAVQVILVTTGESHEVELPIDVLVDEVLPALVEALALPTEFRSGYSLVSKTRGVGLEGHLTLRQNGVRDQEILGLHVEMDCG